MTTMVMTNSVISQAPKMEIALLSRHAHKGFMPATPHALPDETKNAMQPEAIGHRLRLLREALNMSPSEMSDALGIERTYWSRFEKGRRAITDPVAALLVVRYGVTLDFLILGRWDKLPFDLAEAMKSVERGAPK
jgi:plasmid maintenance system antidote protein VapI